MQGTSKAGCQMTITDIMEFREIEGRTCKGGIWIISPQPSALIIKGTIKK